MKPVLLVPFLLLGLAAGVASGVFGIGGGIIIIPSLIYLFGFTEHQAVGTSLAALVPPVAIFGALEYYRAGNVQIWPAVLTAVGIFLGARYGAVLSHRLSGPELRMLFGVFVCLVGVSLVVSARSQ
jgi:uncharacterized membrane protein YfcA